MHQAAEWNNKQQLAKPLHLLNEKLIQLHEILKNNSYVKYTNRRLQTIIEDIQNVTMMLVVGNERVGKTTLINALLGRQLFTNTDDSTKSTIFLRYGEQECLKLHFLDGIVAIFDLKKLDFFASSSIMSAQIIREYVDYVEVFIRNDFLKEMTLIDAKALEVGADGGGFVSDSLLSRIHEVLFVLKVGTPANAAEVRLMQKLTNRHLKPTVIFNAKDLFEGNTQKYLDMEYARFGQHIEQMIDISAKQAIEARNTNNAQLLIDSNFTEMWQLMNRLKAKPQQKDQNIVARILEWLHLFNVEFRLLTEREPFLSVLAHLQQQDVNQELSHSKQQRDMAIMDSYEEEYRHVSGIFKGTETLYQLLQILAVELYLRDNEVEAFEEQAMVYHQEVREYRRMHSEYVSAFIDFEKNHKRAHQKELRDELFAARKQNGFLQQQCDLLNEQQKNLQRKYTVIKMIEQEILSKLSFIQQHLQQNVLERVATINNHIVELYGQREQEQKSLVAHSHKLEGIVVLQKAQQFIACELSPILLDGTMSLTANQQEFLQSIVDQIVASSISYEQIIQKVRKANEEVYLPIGQSIEEKYTVSPLVLKPENVVSEFPTLPKILQVSYILA